MLGRRILTAAVLIPLALAGLFLLSNDAWGIASAIVIAIGAWEWGRLAGWTATGRVLFTALMLLSCLLAYLTLGHVSSLHDALPVGTWLLALGFWLGIATPWVLRRWQVRSTPALLIAGWWVLFPAWLAVWHLQREPGRLLALMAVIWVADSAAYFTGRKFGRRKLAPLVSPGKSWEGVYGALAGVAVYFGIVEWFRPGLLAPGAAVFTLVFLEVVVILSIVGDLFESWMKREAGLKDSGSILPGHGGILDRLDSLTASLPVMALFVWWTTGRPA
jgi:phosphatidate cytidylyltransferase